MSSHPELTITTPQTVQVAVYWELKDPKAYADAYAKQEAAERDRPIIVKLTGTYDVTSEKADPPSRSTNIVESVETNTLVEETGEARSEATEFFRASELYGLPNFDDEPDAPAGDLSSLIGNAVSEISRGNLPREISGLISALESVMMDLPDQILGKFTQSLPPALKSLLPIGELSGLVKKGPVSLNGLINAIGGTALGQVANDALRTVTAIEDSLSNVSQLLNNANLQNINIENLFQSPEILGRISNEISSLGQKLEIPLPTNFLETATGIVLQNVTSQINIPLNLIQQNLNKVTVISEVLNKVTNGSIPIIPSNLSIPNLLSSGFAQNLPSQFVEKLFSPSQVTSLLPGNLRNQIPNVPPRVSGNRFTQNSVGVGRQAAPESGRGGDGPSGPATHTAKPALATEAGARIDYSQKISTNYTLGDVTIKPNSKNVLRPQHGLSRDQIVKNLSLCAVNILEPIRENYSGFYITSGLRPQKGRSDHERGRAVDIQWGNRSSDEVFDIAHWIRDNLEFKQLIFEHGNRIWLHIAFEEGKNDRRVNHWHPTLTRNPRYPPGLRNFYSGRR
jgi:hypothetical protein